MPIRAPFVRNWTHERADISTKPP